MPLPISGRRGLPILPFLLLVLHALPARLPRCAAESATCLALYREGGAPAVFQSAHCPRWTLPPHDGQGDGGGKSSPMGCHVAADRGRRRSQEDRAVCALGIRIPFVEQMRIKEVDVGVVAIFDGHNGAEASEMASKLFLDYFLLHVYFLLDGIYSMLFRKSTGKLTYREATILNNVFNLYKDDQSNHGKRYGVISTPELTGWQILSENDTFLIASSDGKGTTDNVAAVIVPLGSPGSTGTTLKDWSQFEDLKTSISPVLNIPYGLKPDDGTSSAVIDMEYFKRSSIKFQRFLVEAKLGCFYLSESLDEDTDYIFRVPEAYQREEDFNHMPAETVLYSDGNLEKYKDRHFCLYLGHQDGEMGRCNGPEAFAIFFGLLDSLPHNGSKSNGSRSFGNTIDFRYKLKRRFDRGSYGEVWLAFHWNCSEDADVHKEPPHFTTISKSEMYNCTSSDTMSSDEDHVSGTVDGDLFILKRIMVERGNAAYLSGLREKYFGELFSNASRILEGLLRTESSTISLDMQYNPDIHLERNMSAIEEPLKHVARFIESFESESREIWLVYHNEGRSLSKLIYTAEETKLVTGNNNERVRHIQVLHPSKWWHWLRTTKAGQKQMQNLLWQLLMGLKACHDRNITHRDIKPENMIICFEDMETGKCLREVPSEAKQNKLNMCLIDFGSAIDDYTLKNLYGSGPTRSEQTFEYTPLEALLNSNWFQGSKCARLKYDMWSVGVVMLELMVGSPHVFQISDRTRILMDQCLEGWSEQTKELAYKLRSYMELCILVPGISSQHHGSGGPEQGQFGLASWKCSEESFAHQVKIRDPLKIGLVFLFVSTFPLPQNTWTIIIFISNSFIIGIANVFQLS
ncbi:unnamed protein product [Miscanthus lutarioriparius]|uniref:protein-serine/threonine phosphatase n=1 Tax=Miscanthus lutarioriparius TaxID=422564 RepID=A0A811QCM2_9POAL|nr:unnamed protein product [Miscanthus lutarioriparius]